MIRLKMINAALSHFIATPEDRFTDQRRTRLIAIEYAAILEEAHIARFGSSNRFDFETPESRTNSVGELHDVSTTCNAAVRVLRKQPLDRAARVYCIVGIKRSDPTGVE